MRLLSLYLYTAVCSSEFLTLHSAHSIWCDLFQN